jgi:hypothetical protein
MRDGYAVQGVPMQSAVGYAASLTKLPQGPSLIGETTQDISGAAERAWRIAGGLREFNDGIHGSQPEPNNTLARGAGEPPSTRAQSLRQQTSFLLEALTAIEVQMERLNNV